MSLRVDQNTILGDFQLHVMSADIVLGTGDVKVDKKDKLVLWAVSLTIGK